MELVLSPPFPRHVHGVHHLARLTEPLPVPCDPRIGRDRRAPICRIIGLTKGATHPCQIQRLQLRRRVPPDLVTFHLSSSPRYFAGKLKVCRRPAPHSSLSGTACTSAYTTFTSPIGPLIGNSHPRIGADDLHRCGETISCMRLFQMLHLVYEDLHVSHHLSG